MTAARIFIDGDYDATQLIQQSQILLGRQTQSASLVPTYRAQQHLRNSTALRSKNVSNPNVLLNDCNHLRIYLRMYCATRWVQSYDSVLVFRDLLPVVIYAQMFLHMRKGLEQQEQYGKRNRHLMHITDISNLNCRYP